nr:hypothetical protein [uncultured Pseudoxanthomonas sp.]
MAVARFRDQLATRLNDDWSRARPEVRHEFVVAVLAIYDKFHQASLADRHFAQAIATGGPAQHAQRLAELLLADHLWKNGFHLSSASEGPDFHATKNGESVWIELVTPEPNGIDPTRLADNATGVWSFPHKEIALRYTAALKEKHQKLIGPPAGKPGYLGRSLVGPTDRYVIAINQHLLQRNFRSLNGISQIPVACEIAFAVGPRQLMIQRSSGRVVGSDYSHRPGLIKNPVGALPVSVPADSFLHDAYKHVSAIYALDLMEEVLVTLPPGTYLASEHLSAVVYNPNATNPLPTRPLPAQTHWGATMRPSSIEVQQI